MPRLRLSLMSMLRSLLSHTLMPRLRLRLMSMRRLLLSLTSMSRSPLSLMLMPRLRLRLMSMLRSLLSHTLTFRFPLSLTSTLSQPQLLLLLQSLLMLQLLLMLDMLQLLMPEPQHTPDTDMDMPQLPIHPSLLPQSLPPLNLPYSSTSRQSDACYQTTFREDI